MQIINSSSEALMLSYFLSQIGKETRYVSTLVVHTPQMILGLSSTSLKERLTEGKKSKYKRNKCKTDSTHEIHSLHI